MKKTNYELVKNYQVTMNGLGFNSVKDFVDFLNLPAPESILDRQEKTYLKNVVAPFWKEIKYIVKQKDVGCGEYISIIVNTCNGYERVMLPSFPNDTMYKNMELRRQYTLKELGITFRERK
jgi:hypothetical protein